MDDVFLGKSSKRSDQARQPLSEREWKFDAVPTNELEACYLYEYAREFFRVSKTLQQLRAEWEKLGDEPTGKRLMIWPQAQDLLETNYGHFPCVPFEHFPKVAWQDLPADRRSWSASNLNHRIAWRRKSHSDRLHIETLRQCEPARIRTMEAFKDYHRFFHERLGGRSQQDTEYGFFAIDWSFRDPEIRRAFNHWLAAQREETRRLGLGSSKFVSNRGGFRDRLHWLGALRVKRHYRYSELVGHADTNLKVDAPYSHYPDLRENAKKAEEEAGRLFPKRWSRAEYRRRTKEQERRIMEAGGIPTPEEYEAWLEQMTSRRS